MKGGLARSKLVWNQFLTRFWLMDLLMDQNLGIRLGIGKGQFANPTMDQAIL